MKKKISLTISVNSEEEQVIAAQHIAALCMDLGSSKLTYQNLENPSEVFQISELLKPTEGTDDQVRVRGSNG